MADKSLFSTEEAAAYLGISVAALKYHVHIGKNLTPEKVGNSLVFTRPQLDHFLANKRPQGRPKKSQENPPHMD
jgi:hypothetical protein